MSNTSFFSHLMLMSSLTVLVNGSGVI